MKHLFALFVIALSCTGYANDKPSNAEQAVRECQAMVDAQTNRVAFDACMKAKGFERPKG